MAGSRIQLHQQHLLSKSLTFMALVPPNFDVCFEYILFCKHLRTVAAHPFPQMFDNAQKYNSPDTIFYKTAKSMQEASRKMIDSARGTLGECTLGQETVTAIWHWVYWDPSLNPPPIAPSDSGHYAKAFLAFPYLPLSGVPFLSTTCWCSCPADLVKGVQFILGVQSSSSAVLSWLSYNAKTPRFVEK